MASELQTLPSGSSPRTFDTLPGSTASNAGANEQSSTLDNFRNAPTTSEQLANQPGTIDQRLSQPSLAQHLGLNDESPSHPGSGTSTATADKRSQSGDPSGKPISETEYSLLKRGDFKGFWRSRFQAGDPVARTALTGWGDPDYVDASTFERLAASHTWSDLSGYIDDHKLPVTMEQIGLELARAHAQAVMNDDKGVHYLLSPHQVADYHHNVFIKHGIPSHLFGGTHQIGGHWYLPDISVPSPDGWAPTQFDADVYSGLWCKGCDTKP